VTDARVWWLPVATEKIDKYRSCVVLQLSDRYYERRQKNNLAAKRSREAHKRNIESLERTAMQFENENRYYTAQNRLLRAQVEHYQELIARPPMTASRLKEELENVRWNPGVLVTVL